MKVLTQWLTTRWRPLAAMAGTAMVLIAVSAWVTEDLTTSKEHFRVGFAGSTEQLRWLTSWMNAPKVGVFRESLVRDFVLIGCYVPLFVALALGMPDGLRLRRLSGLRKAAIVLAVLAGAADVAENVTLLNVLHDHPGGGWRFSSNSAALAVMALSLLKSLAFVGAVLATLIRLWSLLAPTARWSKDDRVEPVAVPPAGPTDVGICCSGGGIRAAGYALGVLDGLEQQGRWVQRSSYLAAVSGGNYAATGWATAAMTGGPEGATGRLIARLQSPLVGVRAVEEGLERDRTASQKHRYLKAAPGGLPRALWRAGLVLLAHLAVLFAVTFVVAWPVGRLIGSETLVDTGFPTDHVLERRDWIPALLVLGFAVVLGLLALWRPLRPWLRTASLVTAAIAVAGLVLFVVVPWAIVTVRDRFTGESGPSPEAAAWGIAGISGATFLGWLWALAKGKFKRRLPYLGGLVMAALLALLGGKIATDAAMDTGWFSASDEVWGAVLVALLAAYTLPGIQWASFRPIYTRGLRASFVVPPAAGSTGSPGPIDWDTLAAQTGVPELIVCCAAQRVGLSRNGVPASSFTISPHRVTHGDLALPRADYSPRIPKRLQRTFGEPVGWMAVSGAAFASAMGRHSKGTTNAVLAALGVNLGVWVPSPSRVRDGWKDFPRARMGYLVKEVFGVYDANDDMVFVSDGGHWENLGLVELLRRGCRHIVCIDASGDTPGSFTTLREALALALTELDTVVSFDLGDVNAAGVIERGLLPTTSTMTIGVTFKEGAPGTIHYANVRVAADQPLDVRRFAGMDPTFPHYSTGDQFLDDQQFHFLLEAGRHAGCKVGAALEKALKAASAPTPGG